MEVAIKLMSMGSDPGYVSSSGYQEAILVKVEEAAICGADSEALWDLEGIQIQDEDLTDIEHRSSRHGVLNYSWVSGVYDVPEGFVVVQRISENVCTDNQPYDKAWVVNKESLLPLYRERMAMYQDLIQAATAMFDGSGGGIGDLKRAVKEL